MQSYLGALRRAALFRGMEDEQILTAVDCLGGQLRRYQKGAAVLRAGEPATHLGVVLTGQVQVSRARADGQLALGFLLLRVEPALLLAGLTALVDALRSL